VLEWLYALMVGRPGDAADTPLYNTAAVVQRTGLSAATFRAWERRYAFPRPYRTASGQRLYSERDIAALQWLAERTKQGLTISRAIDMLRQGHAQVEPRRAAPETEHGYQAVRTKLREALLAFAPVKAEAVLDEALALYAFEDVCLEIIAPVLVDIGEGWHTGHLSIVEEHYASTFLRTRLSSLMHAYMRDSSGPLIFTGCAPGEQHELGVLMVTLFLLRAGYRVRFLGANVPAEALKEPIERHRPAVLALSAQDERSALTLVSVAEMLGTITPPRPVLVFGGQAFNEAPALRDGIAGVFGGADARMTLATIAGVTGGPALR